MRLEDPSSDLLSIGRLIVRHDVPEGMAGVATDRVDRAIERELRAVLSQEWKSDPADRRVILIRRVRIGHSLHAGWEEQRIIQSFARTVLTAIRRRVDDPTGPDVVVFPDRAAYLGCFLAAKAGSGSIDAWYFREFDGVRDLPASIAIRTCACDELETWLIAMRGLVRAQCSRIVAALTPEDTDRVLDRCCDMHAGADLNSAWQAIIGQWDSLSTDAPVPRGPESPRRAPAAALLRLVALLRNVPSAPVGATALLLRAWTLLDAPDVQGGGRLSPSASAGANVLSRRLPPDAATFWRRTIAVQIQTRATSAGNRSAARPTGDSRVALDGVAAAEPRWTRSGGLFLLLPFFDSAIGDASTGQDAGDGSPVGPIIRAAVARLCLGARGRAVVVDPLWRDLLGLSPDFTADGVECWLVQRASTEAPASPRPDPVQSEANVIVLSCPCPDGEAAERRVRIAIDESTGMWLGVGSVTGETEPTADDDRCQPIEERASRDLKYLAGDSPWALDSPLGCALVAAAQRVLRSFAARLRGFRHASLEHLCVNFLDVGADVESAPLVIRVMLDRPPLHPLLGMSGLIGHPRGVPWLDPRPMVVEFRD